MDLPRNYRSSFGLLLGIALLGLWFEFQLER